MGPHAQALGHTLPAVRTLLAGVVCRNRAHSLAGTCCLACEDGAKLGPTRVADALGEIGIAHQITDLQVFEKDHVVVPQQRKRGLVVEVPSLPLDPLMPALEQGDGLAAAVTALFATRDAALGLGKLLL